METFLYILFFISCIVLIISVLLQPGKLDAGALFTSGINSAALNSRGTASVLSKLTIVAATIFMISALLLSLPAIKGDVSILETTKDSKSAKMPAANPAETNSNTSAPSNVAPATDKNSVAAKPSEEKSANSNTSEKK
ncbi:MAG: preprotein translocase subunit SecG [Pyrinomonadaceae bacterium]